MEPAPEPADESTADLPAIDAVDSQYYRRRCFYRRRFTAAGFITAVFVTFTIPAGSITDLCGASIIVAQCAASIIAAASGAITGDAAADRRELASSTWRPVQRKSEHVLSAHERSAFVDELEHWKIVASIRITDQLSVWLRRHPVVRLSCFFSQPARLDETCNRRCMTAVVSDRRTWLDPLPRTQRHVQRRVTSPSCSPAAA